MVQEVTDGCHACSTRLTPRDLLFKCSVLKLLYCPKMHVPVAM
jgi:hypothetical protein